MKPGTGADSGPGVFNVFYFKHYSDGVKVRMSPGFPKKRIRTLRMR